MHKILVISSISICSIFLLCGIAGCYTTTSNLPRLPIDPRIQNNVPRPIQKSEIVQQSFVRWHTNILTWDYINNTGNFINDESNIIFFVYSSTDLLSWSKLNVTSLHNTTRVTTNPVEFYKVITYNKLTQKYSF